MSDIFVSYARSTTTQAQAVAEALRAQGYVVWLDDELPAHRAYAEVIEERLKAAKAVVVIWSADACKSEWVQSEADRARADHKLVQLRIDGAALPMPFDRIQCADLTGWTGDADSPGWRKVVASIGDLLGGVRSSAMPVAGAPPPLPTKPSIAVMPFANLSGDAEQEYFADGMVEEIVAALTRVRLIFVIASGSGLSFKGKGVTAQEAARQLGVRYVLEGSVRKAGGRVRIAVKLMDASDGSQMWADRFEDTLEDVFALQDRVALAVAGRIEPTVHQAEVRRASARPTDHMGSYDLYLRAYPLALTFNKFSMAEALDLLNSAISLDPDFGLALGLAATCHQTFFHFGWSGDPEHNRREGIELAHRALKSVTDDAMVLAWSASALIYLGGDADTCVRLAERAAALNPGSAFVRLTNCAVRTVIGQPDLALEHLEASMRLDPFGFPLQIVYLGMVRFLQGRFDEAAPAFEEFSRATDHPNGAALLAATYGHLGRTGEAKDALARHRALTSQPIEVIARSILRNPDHVKLFLDGIAVAEGRSTPENGLGA